MWGKVNFRIFLFLSLLLATWRQNQATDPVLFAEIYSFGFFFFKKPTNVREVEYHPDAFVQVIIEQFHVKRQNTESLFCVLLNLPSVLYEREKLPCSVKKLSFEK